jgi:hypothetical protein
MNPIKKTNGSNRLTWLWLICLVMSAWANAGQVVGKVSNVSGPLVAKKIDGVVKILTANSEVEQGDILITEKATYARIKFIDNSEITLRPATQLKIDNFSYDEAKPEGDNAFFNLVKGGLRSVTGALGKRNREKVAINTPTATIGIRGTTFIVEYVEGDAQAVAQTIPAFQHLAALSASQISQSSGDIRSDAPLAFLPEPMVVQLAQGPAPSGGGLAPGLYVQVIDGLIQLSNRGGVQQFAAGQFGFTGSIIKPPVIVPNNPGIKFTPPPSFSASNSKSGDTSGDKPKVDCEVR